MADIIRSARKTFALASGDQFNDSLCLLKSLVKKLQASDIGLTAADVQFYRNFLFHKPPVRFMSIHEEESFTVTAFVIAHNHKIPLHDHPGMSGIIKCVSGRIRVTAYSPMPQNRAYVLPADISMRVAAADRQHLIPCLKLPDSEASAECDRILTLCPDSGNIHEVESVSGTSAFVDILFPPYRDESHCHYYRVIGSGVDAHSQQNLTWLLPVRPPINFFTETIPYRGPDVV
jgi:cysteamine dioxygenase